MGAGLSRCLGARQGPHTLSLPRGRDAPKDWSSVPSPRQLRQPLAEVRLHLHFLEGERGGLFVVGVCAGEGSRSPGRVGTPLGGRAGLGGLG
jgi:hypothetical protein